jgi:hypothetical protein
MVNDARQAEEMVNKVFEYYDLKSYGSWRNNFALISDDSDISVDASLQNRTHLLILLLPKTISKCEQNSARFLRSRGICWRFTISKARTDFFYAFELWCLII